MRMEKYAIQCNGIGCVIYPALFELESSGKLESRVAQKRLSEPVTVTLTGVFDQINRLPVPVTLTGYRLQFTQRAFLYFMIKALL